MIELLASSEKYHFNPAIAELAVAAAQNTFLEEALSVYAALA